MNNTFTEMGKTAYSNGITCPALDAVYSETLTGVKIGNPNTVKNLKSWWEGYNTEHSKAVEDGLRKLGWSEEELKAIR